MSVREKGILSLDTPEESKSNEKSELCTLIKQRGIIKGHLTRYSTYIHNIDPSIMTNVSYKQLGLKIEKIQAMLSNFYEIQEKIELLHENIDEQILERETVENRFLEIIAEGQELMESSPAPKNAGSDNGSLHSCQSNHYDSIKLPTIKLPTFDGNYLQWLEFRDTFESMINNNKNMPDINKFHYLRSSLIGSASVVIKSLEFCGNNFNNAWNLLCQRYDNKNVLINNHLKYLFSIEPLKRDSFKALRFIIDHVSKHLRALDSLGQPTDKWDALIIFMVSSKLDNTTSEKWEEHKTLLNELPTLEDFFSFLRNRSEVLETSYNRIEKSEHKLFSKESKSKYNNQSNSFIVSLDKKSKPCVICKEAHLLHQCSKFREMSVEDRINEISKHRLCKNCLLYGHNSFTCRLKAHCKFCKNKHNSMLHRQTNVIQSTDPTTSSALQSSLSTFSKGQVLLCTALVEVILENNSYTARALLDTGSQSSFITERFKDCLKVSGDINSVNISGINNVKCNITETCQLQIKSRVNAYNFSTRFLVVPQITGLLPNSMIDINKLQLPYSIKLADPTFHIPSEIDILLGADVYWNLIGEKTIKLGVNKPILQSSKLGWLVAGPLIISPLREPKNSMSCNFSQLNDAIEKFWKLDDLPVAYSNSLEEKLCEAHFKETVSRLSCGRFSVQMPMKENPREALHDNFYAAKRCLDNLYKKLNKNPELKQKYTDFLKEYRDLGHLTKIDRPNFGYYMPHHAVIREKSETTKLRTVFNASMKTSSGKSLNDIQMVGPVVQSDLMAILLRFRQHKYILIGDIEKMYRQIEVDSSQRHLQLILWREEMDKPIQILQLNTITYGTASAPFLSTRCLLQLALECSDPIIANVIRNDFYMDDLNTGHDTVEGLKHIADGVIGVLNSACLPLRKLRSNCFDLFINHSQISESLDLYKESTVLGLNYSPKADTLQFSRDLALNCKITKRSVISITSKIFDPLGLLCPCVIVAKILIQNLWCAKLDWDDEVPVTFSKNWSKLLMEFSVLFDIQIPRCVLNENPRNIQLHCFADASQAAYAACVYLRSEGDSDTVVKLLCAKAKVAPIKPLTIPRLELCGALLGARLSIKVLKELRCNITQKYIWTDSTVVLGWLKTPPRDLKMFVCNRVNEINELASEFYFKHVPTTENPADLASRGVDPKQLKSSLLWWEGPTFLKRDICEWPSNNNLQPKDLPELKNKDNNSVNCNVSTMTNLIDFENYSNFNKLKRICAYVLRFINNCKNKNLKYDGPLDITELNNSLHILVKTSQSQSFSLEIEALKCKNPLSRKSKLLSLSPFIDTKGILRVGGRLENSLFNYDKKHPMILDSKHHLTKLIMSHEHLHLFHAGPQLLLAAVREQFWPIGGRNLARSIVQRCLICTRFRGKAIQPMMGNLPYERTTSTFTFHSCGVDMAGPFMISSRKGRGNRITKCYLCLFVCLSSKAVHLELVSDLSTDAFLLSLKRFISRRGKPSIIYCDNGSNFKGACNEIGRLLRSSRRSVIDFSSNEGIKFVFSPAYSPHFGGIWEAGIKSAKHHLKRIAGNASLTFEELTTLFAQIEAILNSRPLTPLSSDSTDLSPLTPGHFLIGRPLMALPSPPVTAKHLNRYQLIEKLRQHFWERWRREFVAELQQKTKWQTRQQELQVGDLIILKEDNLPPLSWRLGRISRLYPGRDGISRVADVITSNGIIRRAINKMCALPAESQLEGRS